MGQGQSAPRQPAADEMQCWIAGSQAEAKNPRETITKIPTPIPGHVVIRVAAAGIHPHDIVRAPHTHSTRYPAIPGTDGVGTIHAIGEDVTGWEIGQWVMFRVQARSMSGSWAQYSLAEAKFVVPYPAQVGLALAAALPTPWWSAQLIYDYLVPRAADTSSGTPGSCLIVGADCENGVEIYLCDLLKASSPTWEVTVICDDRKEGIYTDHGFDAVVPAKSIPKTEVGTLNIPAALQARGRARPWYDLIVVLRAEVAGVVDGRDLAPVCKFGATVVFVDATTTGTGLNTAAGVSHTQAITGLDAISADLMMFGVNIRLFSLDAWMHVMPLVVSAIAQRGPPARVMYTESVQKDRSLEAITAVAQHRVRTKVAVIIAPTQQQQPTLTAASLQASQLQPAMQPPAQFHQPVAPAAQTQTAQTQAAVAPPPTSAAAALAPPPAPESPVPAPVVASGSDSPQADAASAQ